MGLFDRFKKNKKIDFQIAFEKNLKYISNLEKEVSDIESQFVKTENRFYLKVGEIDCPTGWIVVADPLAYLPNLEFSPVLEKKVPKGKYPVYVSLARSDELDVRMCTVKMKIKKTKAVKYELANPTENTASFKASDGIVPGFPVDSGLVSICDEKVAKEYALFLENWQKENSGKNFYGDYFEKYFIDSYNNNAAYQRDGGDFIEWANPITKNKLVMVASGFGDGLYQAYFGYDKDNKICEIIIPLINPDFFGI